MEPPIDQAIHPTLLQFVAMLEHGADIKSQLKFVTSKRDIAIVQMIQRNCYATYNVGVAIHRYSKGREKSYSLYTWGSPSTQRPERERWWK